MRLITTFLTMAFVAFSMPVLAEDMTSEVSVSGAYSYATAGSQKNGVVFGVIANNTDHNISVVGAETNAEGLAERLELHSHIMDGDVMMMRKVESYDIPAGESVTLEAMGHHIMIMGLAAPLKAGDTVPVILTLDNGEHVEFIADVKSPGDTGE